MKMKAPSEKTRIYPRSKPPVRESSKPLLRIEEKEQAPWKLEVPMFLQRSVAIVVLCAAAALATSTSAAQTQGSGPRAELGPQVNEPHPDYGAVNGKRYVNGYFGFSYAYPEGFDGNAVQSTGSSPSLMYNLFTASPTAQGGTDMRYISITCDAIKANDTAKAFADASIKTFSPGFDVLHNEKKYMFGGRQFYRIDMVSKSAPGTPKVYQSQVFAMLPNFAVSFSFMATKPDDIDALVHSMESISFVQAERPASAPLNAAKTGQTK
jgi:hypothetical protein